MISVVFKTEYLQLKRSIVLMSMLLVYALFGVYAIYYGKQTVEAQKMKITAARDSVDKAQSVYLTLLHADTTSVRGKYNYEKAALPSLVRFTYPFLAYNAPEPLSALCIGQRDIYPLYYVLNGQSYYIQTLKGDIYNPFKLSSGNFDLAFVIIYLLPLILSGFCFDLLSAEKQSGTDKLIIIASVNYTAVLMTRLLFRTLLILVITVLLSVAGFVFCEVTDMIAMLAWNAVVVVYLAFWAGLIFWINSLKKEASFNAIMALVSWVTILIIIPTGINLMINQKQQPHQLQLASLMRSRNMPEVDSAMHKALQEFYQDQAQYQPMDTARSANFMSEGYSAFLFNGDRRADLLVASTTERQKDRERWFNWFNIIDPSYNAAELFSQLSGSTERDERIFKERSRAFHREVFHFTARPLFANRKMSLEDYRRQPQFKMIHDGPDALRWLLNIALLAIGTIALWFLGWRRIVRHTSN